MPLQIESIDDPPIPDGTLEFSGGMASFPPPTKIGANQFALGGNTMITKLGVIQTRRGWEQVGPLLGGGQQFHGFGYLDTAAGTRKLLVLTASQTPQAYDGSTWANAAGYTPTAANIAIVQGIDKLYLSNGADNPRSWDGTTFVDLGSGATDAPKALYLAWGTNRLIAAGITGSPDTVAFSDILDPSSTHWSAANRIRVGAGDGDPITGIAMWTKTLLVVFKRRRIFTVDINPTVSVSNFVIDEVPVPFGCIAHRSVAKVGRDLWFLASDLTVRSLSRVLNGEESEATSVSLPIYDLLAAIPESYAAHAVAVFFKDRYLLSYDVPVGYGKVAAFNTQLGVWEGLWTKSGYWNPIVFAVTKFSSLERLMSGGNAGGQVQQWRSYNSVANEVAADFQDAQIANGTGEIATQITTRAHAFGADFNSKRGLAVEVEFDTSTAPSATVKIVPDEGTPVTLSSSVTPSGRVTLTLLHQPAARTMAFDLTSASGKLAVRAVKASAFLQTMPVNS